MILNPVTEVMLDMFHLQKLEYIPSSNYSLCVKEYQFWNIINTLDKVHATLKTGQESVIFDVSKPHISY